MKIPTTNAMALTARVSQANNLMPSADQFGASQLIRNAEVSVPSSHSAPPHQITQIQNRKLPA